MAGRTVSELVVRVNSNISEALSGMNKVGARAAKMGKTLRRTGFRMSRNFTAPIVAIGGAALKTAADFEQAMNRVQGLTGATGSELEKLEALAKDLGTTTQFSASESADAMGFLAQAGFETREIMEALPDVLNLAAAGQMELAEAADLSSNVLSGFGKEASELGAVGDMLVQTANELNTNVPQLGAAFEKVGPIAADVGISFEETSAALGLLGQAGIQGEKAGTALTKMFSRLLNPVPKVEQALGGLGLSLRDVSPATNTLTEIIGRLEESGAGAAEILAIFGEEGKGLAPLIAQGGDAVATMTEKIRNSSGAAQEMADVQMQGLSGAMKALKSAAEGLAIAFSEAGLIQAFTDVVSKVTEVIRNVAEMNPKLFRIAAIVASVVAAIGPLLLISGKLVGAFVSVVAVAGKVGAVIAGLSTPVGIAIAAVAGLTAVWLKWGDEIKGVVLRAVDALLGGLEWITQVIPNLSDKVSQARAGFNRWASDVMGLRDEIGNLSRSVVSLVPRTIEAAGGVGDFSEKTRDAMRDAGGLADSTNKLSGAMSTFTSLIRETKTVEERLAETRTQLKMLVDEGRISREQMNAALEVARQRLEDAADSTQGLTEKERLLQEQLRMAQAAVEATRTKKEQYRQKIIALDVALQSGEISQSEYNRAVRAAEADLKGLSEAMRVYDGLIETTKTQEEKLQETRTQLTALVDAGKISQEELNAAMAAARKRMDELESGAGSAGEGMLGLGKDFTSVAKSIGDKFVSMAQRGKFAIGDFVSDAIAQLTKLLTSKALTQLFGTALGGPLGGLLGGLAGGLFGGLFAEGGFLPAGQFGIVGEEGPEVIRSTSKGVHIEPMGGGAGGMAMAGGGGGGATSVNVNLSLRDIPEPPRPLNPQAAAVDTWWRELFSRLAIDGRSRGAL